MLKTNAHDFSRQLTPWIVIKSTDGRRRGSWIRKLVSACCYLDPSSFFAAYLSSKQFREPTLAAWEKKLISLLCSVIIWVMNGGGLLSIQSANYICAHMKCRWGASSNLLPIFGSWAKSNLVKCQLVNYSLRVMMEWSTSWAIKGHVIWHHASWILKSVKTTSGELSGCPTLWGRQWTPLF